MIDDGLRGHAARGPTGSTSTWPGAWARNPRPSAQRF